MVKALQNSYQICNIVINFEEPPFCNIVINWGDLQCNIVINLEDPSPPIPYYVIYGQPLMKRCQKIWAGTSLAWLFNEINPDTFRQNSTCTFPALSTTQQSLLHSLPESHLDVLGYYWKPRDIWIVGLQCQRLLWLSFPVSCTGFGASSSTSSHVCNIHKRFELSKM